MINTICEHPGAAFQLMLVMGGIIAALIALLVRFIGLSYRKDSKMQFLRLEELHKEALATWEKIEEKIDQMGDRYVNCQRELPEKYVTRPEFTRFLSDR